MRSNRRRAGARVGRDTEQRLRWLLTFADRDLSAVSRDNFDDARAEIDAFMAGAAPLGQHGVDSLYVRDAPRVVRACQAWLRAGLRKLTAKGTWRDRRSVEYLHFFRDVVFPRAGDEIKVTSSFVTSVGPGKLPLLNLGKWFAWAVHETLRSARGRLKRCANARCRRLLVAHRRQEYCGRECSQAVRDRIYDTKHRDELAERRYARYESRVRKTHPHARVARRRRRPAQPAA